MKECTTFCCEDQPLFACFASIPDPRVSGRCTYPLMTIMVIVLCAILAGFDDWKAIELFARKRRRLLSRLIDLSIGIPSHYTLARVFSLIEPAAFENCFATWIQEITQLLTYDVVSLDGKTIRGSGHAAGDKKATHIINAYSDRLKATLGCIKTPDKSNEIKGIPLLLKKLNIVGCVLTMDAMGTQKGIANLIREKKAHYVLALKENHRRLFKKVHRLFEQALAKDFKTMVCSKKLTTDYDHTRIEERHYTILPLMYLPQYKHIWRDLSAFVQVRSTRHLSSGVIEEATRYYLTSLPFNKANKVCQAIRSHWAIENSLHYKLDVGLGEDRCQIYRGMADQNLAIMRKIVLKLLEDERSEPRLGIAMKRAKSALDSRYLRKVVGF